MSMYFVQFSSFSFSAISRMQLKRCSLNPFMLISFRLNVSPDHYSMHTETFSVMMNVLCAQRNAVFMLLKEGPAS